MIRKTTPHASRLVRSLPLVIACLTGFAGTSAFADFNSGIIDFDYEQLFVGINPYGPGPAVIGSPGDLWNTADLSNPNVPLNLFKTDGTYPGAVWTIASGGGQSGGVGGTYGKLVDVLTSFYSASISGLTPGQQYSLYLFGGMNWFDHLTVNGVDFYTPGVAVAGGVNSLVEGTDYVVHTVTADPSGNLVFTPIGAGGPNPAYITSWQLTPVPEPGVTTLAALAGAALAARAWARRRTR